MSRGSLPHHDAMAIPRTGNIPDFPLPAVLEGLQKEKATGTLRVRMREAEKTVHFKDGQIVFAASTAAHDRLGEMLVRTGRLSREHLATALELLKKSGGEKKLGALLVERGFVSPKDLFTGLKAQVKEIIYSLFLVEEAAYRFEAGLPPDTIQLQINFEELLVEIIQRIKQQA